MLFGRVLVVVCDSDDAGVLRVVAVSFGSRVPGAGVGTFGLYMGERGIAIAVGLRSVSRGVLREVVGSEWGWACGGVL